MKNAGGDADAFVSQLDAPHAIWSSGAHPSPFGSHSIADRCNSIALYSAVGSEAPTTRLAEYLADEGKTPSFSGSDTECATDFQTRINLGYAGFRIQGYPEAFPRLRNRSDPDLIIAPLGRI